MNRLPLVLWPWRRRVDQQSRSSTHRVRRRPCGSWSCWFRTTRLDLLEDRLAPTAGLPIALASDPTAGARDAAQVIYSADMATDPGWTLDSQWAWGVPTGSGGGRHGSPDPTAGHTGTHVVGYNLAGDYENDISTTRWAVTPAIDCSGYENVSLNFYRWLNVEEPSYDHAYVEVSNNGSSWTTIWQNGTEVTDSSWSVQQFDISAIADGQSTVQVRWGMGTTDGSWQYSGWNLDDVQLAGTAAGPDVRGPAVTGHTPCTPVGPDQSTLTFDFDEPMDATSFSIADDVVSFTGPGGQSLVNTITAFDWLDSDTLEVQFQPQSAIGTYEMVIGPNITDDAVNPNPMDQNDNKTNGEDPGDRYAAGFEVSSISTRWTIMVYLDGDNDLESAGIDDFLEMASVGSGANVNVVVQFDRISGYDATYGDWTDTRRGLVQRGDKPDAGWGTSIGEANMGDPNTLVDFANWAMTNYPAQQYALILWDHGGGWRSPTTQPRKGACWDDTNGDDYLENREVGAALATVSQNLDLFGYDCCLMGMLEVAHEVKDEATVLVASEQTEPGDGWPYDTVLTHLTGSPAWTPQQLASDIVVEYGVSYAGAETLSAVDLTAIGDTLPNGVSAAVSNLAMAIISAATPTDYSRLQTHYAGSSYFTESSHRDLGTFLQDVASDTSLTASIQAAAQTARLAYDQAIIQNHSGPSEGGTGLAIYFQAPGEAPETDYNSNVIDFAADTLWDEFLQWWESGSASVDLVGTALNTTPVSLVNADNTTASFTIANTGVTPTGAFEVELFWSVDADFDNRDELPANLVATDPAYNPDNPNAYHVTGIAGTSTLSDSVVVSVPADPFGTRFAYLGMRIDELGQVSEENESNNHSQGPGIDMTQVNWLATAYSANMDSDPAWTLDSVWTWGIPTGGGGSYGLPDPTSGHTGAHVIGNNLAGDYANNINPTHWATTPAIDCADFENVVLTFSRWLNVEQPSYDHAYVQVSNDATNWTTIWENASEITDSAWTAQTLDIAAVADGQSTVYLRWGIGPTDGSYQYSGWNLDDVSVLGTSTGGPGSSTDSVGIHRGPMWFQDCDGSHTWGTGDEYFGFGITGDEPVVGDWNGDGVDEIGVHRGAMWYLDIDGNHQWNLPGDACFSFGIPGDEAVIGDWNGDGVDEVGVHRGQMWYLDVDGDREWNLPGDACFSFGILGDEPVVGDWNGDGTDQVGVHRGQVWYLDTDGNRQWSPSGDAHFDFGILGDAPLIGDWNGDGVDEVGVHRGHTWYLDVDGNCQWNVAGDEHFSFGIPGDQPLVGCWDSTASRQAGRLGQADARSVLTGARQLTLPILPNVSRPQLVQAPWAATHAPMKTTAVDALLADLAVSPTQGDGTDRPAVDVARSRRSGTAAARAWPLPETHGRAIDDVFQSSWWQSLLSLS